MTPANLLGWLLVASGIPAPQALSKIAAALQTNAFTQTPLAMTASFFIGQLPQFNKYQPSLRAGTFPSSIFSKKNIRSVTNTQSAFSTREIQALNEVDRSERGN
jgi:hypothetical protein